MGNKGKTMLLAGDIGGTNTRLAIFDPAIGPQEPCFQSVYPSGKFTGLEQIVKQFLADCGQSIQAACFGVAGPVSERRAVITNLPWIIEEGTLALELGLDRVLLINDLEAIAEAIPHLDRTDIETLNPGDPVPDGNIALVAPGTGLGEAFLTWDGSTYHAHASEGGHVNFAPSNQLEMELLQFMWQNYKHLSYERVCSGTGIPNIYQFLKQTKRFEEPEWLAREISAANDRSPVIINYALNPDKKAAICIAVLDTFISILGSEAGNLALKVLSTGGVYLGGGIPPRIIDQLKKGEFIRNFSNKGRFSTLLSHIPIHVITNSYAALMGAAYRGIGLCE